MSETGHFLPLPSSKVVLKLKLKFLPISFLDHWGLNGHVVFLCIIKNQCLVCKKYNSLMTKVRLLLIVIIYRDLLLVSFKFQIHTMPEL